MFIEWNDERHSIGFPVIDNQHKELFLITNQLHEVLNKENHKKNAIKVLKRLYAYTGYHFASEESLFKEYAYPLFKDHKSIHITFKNRIKESLDGIRNNPGFSLVPLQDYLVEWILKHIQGEDVKYAEYFKKKSIDPDLHFTISDEKREDVLSEWNKKKLELEINDIDNQHRELIYILQQTNDLQHTSESRKNIYLPIIIQKLFYYSQYHFSYEEEHMSKNIYPSIQEQKDLHKTFIPKIIEFAEEYKKGSITVSDEIILFLKDWTISHILTEDKKYKDFLEGKTSQ
jgi:hemerythrin-like metal-binding protein